ncbi:MAG: glycosylhydrolase-like jelly roll fold domain-containing protein, partial [Saprospiraceae bacterium]
VGRGKVFNNIPLQTVFEKLGISPDFTFSSRSGKAIINYVHRKVNGSDVYFVANRMREREEVVASFRTTGKKPELWHADTGLITAANVYETSSGRTNIALPFEPSGSYFVIFRTPANPVSVIRMEKEGNLVLQSFAFPPKDSGLYTHISNNFTISVWIKPEVEENFSGPYLYNRGIASNVFYPPEGEILYGKGHTACGLVASRNGLAVYERSIGYPTDLQAVLVPISGWTHITLVYKNGIPILYLNGQLVKELKPSANLVHPGLGNEKEDIFSWFFEGDKSEPVLFSEVLSESRIMQLAQKGKPQPAKQQPVQLAENSKSGFLFWENGNYTLHNNKGQNQIIKIEGAGKLAELSTSWEVLFPPNLGAPTKVVLPKLNSLHHNAVDGVKYFSGTATYIKKFKLSANAMILGIRVYLDLGHVEVIAEVKLNGKKLGLLWKPPYRVDITDAIKAGENLLEIEVTNLWPNRLIGDEQLPAENEYVIQGSRGSGIKNLPDWYKEGKPKPEGGRVTFSTWKHFNKESPLLESGLIGPVVIWNAIYRSIK